MKWPPDLVGLLLLGVSAVNHRVHDPQQGSDCETGEAQPGDLPTRPRAQSITKPIAAKTRAKPDGSWHLGATLRAKVSMRAALSAANACAAGYTFSEAVRSALNYDAASPRPNSLPIASMAAVPAYIHPDPSWAHADSLSL